MIDLEILAASTLGTRGPEQPERFRPSFVVPTKHVCGHIFTWHLVERAGFEPASLRLKGE